MIGFIIALIIIGIVAGYIARLLVPGRDPMSFVQTAVLGIVGSFVGGFLGYLLFNKDLDEGGLQASGIIGSIIGAVIALLLYNAATRRGVGRRI
ncbi:MAG TPA: GlsB/YeaQ/YmgE family stress response membrane protein [Acidimicrobiales bacterium]